MIVCVSLFVHLLLCTQREVLKIRVKIISINQRNRSHFYILEIISSDESSVSEKLLMGSGNEPETERGRGERNKVMDIRYQNTIEPEILAGIKFGG